MERSELRGEGCVSDNESTASSMTSKASRRARRSLNVSKALAVTSPLIIALVAFVAVAQACSNMIQSHAAMNSAVAALLAHDESSTRRDYSLPPRLVSRDWWERIVPSMRGDPRRFVRNFRVPFSVMDELVARAETHPLFTVTGANGSRSLSPSLKVHMTLWRLGRAASLSDCAEQFGVSEGFVDKWTDVVLDFISEDFGHRLWGCLPLKSDTAAWNAIAADFASRAGFPNCGGAGDGVLVPIYYQTGTDPHVYFSRKGFYALNFQAVVDGRHRFMYVGGGLPGTVYDGHCWGRTSLGRRLAEGSVLPDGFYFIVDNGYVGNKYMLTGYTKPKNEELPPPQRRYNYLHSLTRGVVERAFGILKARFRWMLRGVQLRQATDYAKWFKVSCILHNMCIDAGEPALAQAPATHADGRDDSEFVGLAGNPAFTEVVQKALLARTDDAIAQAQFGTGTNPRRRGAGVAAATVTAATPADDDEPEATFEEDTRPAREAMLDTDDGKVLRETIFRGLNIRSTKKARTA